MTDAPEEWAGYFRTGSRVEFAKLNGPVTIPGNVTLDLPNQQVFGLAVTTGSGHDGEIICTARFAGQQLRFAGALEAETFTGRFQAGDEPGSFALCRVAIWDPAAYRALSAPYGLADGRRFSVFVNADDWVAAPILFYSENDTFVRLYPDAQGRLISESLELFSLTDGNRSIGEFRSLVRGEDSEPTAVSRLASWAEEPVRISGPDGTLSGTLMKPAAGGPHAAVVLIHGAAGGERDIYRAFAEHFVQAGLAALVYDRRGHGESAGNPEPSFEEKSYDAEAWVDYLQSRPDIQPDRVGVWGLSNGSWVAPLVAARRPDVAFVAVIGASGTTAIETEIHRRTFDLREQGIPAAQIEQVAELWRLVYHVLTSRRPDPAAAARFDELTAALRESTELAEITLQHYAIQAPFLGPVPPYRSYQELVADLPNHAESDEWTCDPADSYRAISVPVLFLVGDNDSNLPPLRSARRVSSALHRAGNRHGTVVLFPNTGHMMNIVELGTETGMSSEEAGYRFHHFRFAGGLLDIVRSWAAARAAA